MHESLLKEGREIEEHRRLFCTVSQAKRVVNGYPVTVFSILGH